MPYRVKEQNIQFSAFKKCYDRDGYILRLYENQGRYTKAKVEISGVFTKAYLAKINEQTVEEIPITNGEIVLEFAPYKALTIKLVCS